MTNNYIYAKRKLGEAIECLVTGSGDVRSRLLVAHKKLLALSEDDFPSELVAEYNQIKSEFIRCGTVAVTLREIRNATGSKIAERILNLKARIDSLSAM